MQGLGPPSMNGHGDDVLPDGVEQEGLGFLDALLQEATAADLPVETSPDRLQDLLLPPVIGLRRTGKLSHAHAALA
ncbi:hypothetical protein WJX84_000156 [Apatococcus fuscideae]|uniref:Uncharacterized protein n=1 Tax=Apatococcus fuscideae TaxID=2026836 RepID=A0AAW1SNF5_9CHLO